MGVFASLHRRVDRVRDGLTETQWDALRLFVVAVTLAFAAWGAHRVLAPPWRRHENRQALAQARRFAAARDYRDMLLALQRATELEPSDRGTWEQVARELDLIHSPDELIAWGVLTRLSPGDPTLRLSLAEAALRFGRYDAAEAALPAPNAQLRRNLMYDRLVVDVAAAEGRWADVRKSLPDLLALAPHDVDAQFTYAALLIWSDNPAEESAGRLEMEKLLGEPAGRVRAAMELLTDAARHHDPERMHAIIRQCLAVFAPDARYNPNSDVSAWQALLAGMERAAGPSPSDAPLFARWMADLGRPGEALAWLETLPVFGYDSPAAAAMAAELAAETDNTPVLVRRLAAGAWGAWPERAWTLAIAAHQRTPAERAAGKPPSWQDAIAACGGSLDALRNLARLAQAWRNDADAERCWWDILKRSPRTDWAFEALRNTYIARGDESGLFELYRQRVETFPADTEACADWIILGCVLDREDAVMDQRAEALPGNADFCLMAKAACRWRQGDPAAAAKLLGRLSRPMASTPAAEFWKALVESDLGNAAATREAAAAAQRAALSAPEAALLKAALEKVDLRTSTLLP